MSTVARHTFSKLFRFAQVMEFWKLFPNGVPQRAKSLLWVCDQLETVENVLKECPLHPAERDLLRKVSPMLDPRILIDTKNGIVTIVKLLDSLPQILCWWFAWLEQLIKVLLCVNNYYQSTALCTAGFNTWDYWWRIWGNQTSKLIIHVDTAAFSVS